jgi:phage terminase large subunit
LPFVARNVIGIIVNNYSIINCINGNMKMTLSEYPTLDELKVSLSKINPKNKLPLFYKNENWIYLFKIRQKSTIQTIERILLAGKHIDEELRSILLNMYSSLYLKEEYAFNSDDFEEEDLSKYSRVIKTHFDLIEKLNSYYNKNLKKYYVFNQK